MIEKSTTQKVLELFFENPSRKFYLRELSRLSRLSMPTIISTTNSLSREKLVLKTRGKVVTNVAANRDEINFARYKILYNLEKIYTSGLIDYLSKAYNRPKSIILFGSVSRGEDIESSDIDIAINTDKKLNLDISKYERILKKTVNIHEINMDKISEEFKANLANGIVLEGSW